MVFLLTNIASFLVIGLILVGSFFYQKKTTQKIFTTFNITISAFFCAMSVVLTNVVGYSYIFGVQMMLGNFLLFLTGMMFGPLIGGISALITDTIGALINMGGAYHAGFMLIKVILGVAGGLVFLFKTNAHWKLKMFSFFTIAYLFVSILSPIFLYTLYGVGYTVVKFVARLARLPIELFIYNSLIYLTFKTSYLFLTFNHNANNKFWFTKNGSLKVHRKKSLREKYQVDLYGNRLSSRHETTIYYQEINYNISIGVVKNG